MICADCQRQLACIPLQLAQVDPKIQQLLEKLKRCELRLTKPEK